MIDIKQIQNMNTRAQLRAVLGELVAGSEYTPNQTNNIMYAVARRAQAIGEYEFFHDFLPQDIVHTLDTEKWKATLENTLNKRNNGKITNTYGNYSLIVEHDPHFKDIAYDELKNAVVVKRNGRYERFSDEEEATLRDYVANEYDGIYNKSYLSDNIIAKATKNSFHPVKQLIEAVKWDGLDRIGTCLTRWLGVEDNAYTREVSRLIFAGGINRIYNPGCKFDDMAVLVGKQGGGKSSFVQWLAMTDEAYTSLKTIDGKESAENIEGMWIVEIEELAAFKNNNAASEKIKAFITTASDKRRKAYGHYLSEINRTCIFIGTTNDPDFIGDKTGGRRFYPVMCNASGYDVHDNKKQCQDYIRQCWAQAYHCYISTDPKEKEKVAPYAKLELLDVIRKVQSDSTVEDYRDGQIKLWLEKNESVDYVCTKLLWDLALDMKDKKDATKGDQAQIKNIMRKMVGWKEVPDRQHRFETYGYQRYFQRVKVGDDLPLGSSSDADVFG